MAKSIDSKKEMTTAQEVKQTTVTEQPVVEQNVQQVVQPVVDTDVVNKLMETIAQMQQELSNLKNKSNDTVSNGTVTTTSSYDKLLDAITNKKSDREVVIIHNREMPKDLATVLELNGVNIQFHKLGEQRVLTWQQFEACVSKYRKLFDKEIILLEAGQDDLMEKYDIPSVNRGSKYIMTKEKLNSLGDTNINQLEEFYNGLTEGDKKSILSYWMGQCYEKSPKFYDRYKLELFNRLSNSNIFDNIITEINNDYARRKID